ncbi:PilZ domain-containing protein [Salinisphaera sp.]|uniref:PilZ domain-containing protein n=1 Tax=Salinisphaera sp. TaxID=1914330 RepID=UPI002D789048|nr:PilZ domain-containing protein [Salinisphaera sp.]HET7315411.1 PilZ domain-containing protein [Salinisphaera sp.]
MDPIFTETLEFHDRWRVIRTLRLIEGQPRTLTLSDPAAGWTITAHDLQIADDENTLVLEAASDDWDSVTLPGPGLALTVTDEGETLAFDGITSLPDPATPTGALRRFSIPERLRLENKRAGLRLIFIKGMSARFEIPGPADEPRLVARVIDLSFGGCQIELPIAAGLTLNIDGAPIEIALVFPNGDRFEVAADVRYVHLLGPGGLARAGLAFQPLDGDRRRTLWLWLQEIEMEIAVRRGERSAARQTVGLFRSGVAHEPAQTIARTPPFRTPMRKSLLDVAHAIARAALALRVGEPLPAARLAAGAERLCALLAEDRQSFMFALATLTDQPPLIQHALAVAGRLLDLIDAEPDLTIAPREIVLGGLLHELGLVSLADEAASTLAAARHHPEAVSGAHAARLLEHIQAEPALAAPAIHALVAGLAGLGQPVDGVDKRVADAARVVKAVDAHVRGYHGQPPITAFDACRRIYRDCERFDDYWVRRYVQRQGPYPIGTIVHYANGFRAQVVEVDERGQPARVRVLRNLNAARHQRLNLLIGGVDLHQLGQLERAVAHEPAELYSPAAADGHDKRRARLRLR